MWNLFAHPEESMNNEYYDHMMGGNHWGNANGSLFVWMLLLILIIVIIAVIIFVNRKSNATDSTTALETLKNRYAKGEITKKQYEAIKKDLS